LITFSPIDNLKFVEKVLPSSEITSSPKIINENEGEIRELTMDINEIYKGLSKPSF
jgi:hypothetical protein